MSIKASFVSKCGLAQDTMPTRPYCADPELDEEAESQQCKHCRYPILDCECEEEQPPCLEPASRSQRCLEHGRLWHTCWGCQNGLDTWKENQNKRQKVEEEKVEEEKEERVQVCSRCKWVPLFCKCPFPQQLVVQEELKLGGVKSCGRCHKHPLYCTCPFLQQPVEEKKEEKKEEVRGTCKLCTRVVTSEHERVISQKLLEVKKIQRYFHKACLHRFQCGGETPIVEELEPICPFCDEMVQNSQKRVIGEHATCHEACLKGYLKPKNKAVKPS